jgi:hypothetical protein
LKATYAFIDGDFDEFPDFLGLNVRAQPGMLPESAATLVMDWDVLKGRQRDPQPAVGCQLSG